MISDQQRASIALYLIDLAREIMDSDVARFEINETQNHCEEIAAGFDITINIEGMERK